MLVKKPVMGFNTWNTFGECYNEDVLREVADAMVDRGFKDAGYNYLIVDDAWALEARDKNTGEIVPRPAKFKDSNIVPTVDYVHSKGLNFGIYSCAGLRTCGAKCASFDYEFIDAKTLAKWGVDYLKYDYCLKPETQDGETLYRRMSLALRHSGRDIVFAACNWGMDDVWSWIRAAGAHTYRSTGDIFDNFDSFKNIFQSQILKLGSNAPGCFNDLDMMTIGMEGSGNAAAGEYGNDATYRIQFCVWCMFQTPLILGCDVRNVQDKYRDLLCNKDLIAINQDIECRPPFPIGCDDRLVFCKLLADGTYAFLFINVGENELNMSFIAQDIGLTEESGCRLQLTDIFSGEEYNYTDGFIDVKVPGKDCRIFKGKLVK